MEKLRIQHLRMRYRLPASHRDARTRLDRVVQQAIEEVVELALERAGVPTHEEICLRDVHVPVRLRLGSTDASLSVDWSVAVAEVIRARIAEGGDGVVRYGSRHHALVDLALCAARGELSRAWAWRQLGLWRGIDEGTAAQASIEAAQVLGTEPRAIVAVLSELARAGALLRFLDLIRTEGHVALARAALSHLGVPEALAVVTPSDDRFRADPALVRRRVERVLRNSAIARAVSQMGPTLVGSPRGASSAHGSLRAILALALLEAEPTAFRPSFQAGATLLSEMERAMDAAHERAVVPTEHGPDLHRGEPDGVRSAREQAAPGTRPASRVDRSPLPGPGATRLDQPTTGSRTGQSAMEVSTPTEERPSSASGIPDVRHRGTTRAAGLLYLLHLVDALGLPDELLARDLGVTRGLRWALHRIALTLLPLEPADPTALAFAGLGPHAAPPSDGEPAPTPEESAYLEGCADRILERLREVLARPDEPRDGLLLSVCRRRGEVLADPGWIEIRMELEQVSTEVRRAGLDLDPDWLPWLGVVVRFVYA